MSNDATKPLAPKMDRTKIQLATTYAPGSLFTFEGNLIVCESIPKHEYRSILLSDYAERQIYDSLEEKIGAWYSSAMGAETVPVPEMCVDEKLLVRDKTTLQEPMKKEIFGFVEPTEMGYKPTLLSFVCNGCKSVRTFENLRQFEKRQAELNTCLCTGSGEKSRWRQLDIVFVHPNGNYEQPLPWQWYYDEKSANRIRAKSRCEACGSNDVRLDDKSSQIGKRFYYCANTSCNLPRDDRWLQNDKEYIEKFSPNTARERSIEQIRMKPVSYRSNAVHYPLQDMIIDFGKSDRLEVLNDLTNNKLISAVADRFGMNRSKPSYEEMRDAVTSSGRAEEWPQYETLYQFKSQGDQPKAVIDAVSANIEKYEKQWEDAGIISTKSDVPVQILQNLERRRDRYARKFDPFRLLIEHETLLDELVSEKRMDNGMRYFTPMDNLDEYIGPEDEGERLELNTTHRNIMDSAGIETLGLLRKFQTIQYSFGYTRVASTPVTNYINDREVPVRLKLFDDVNIEGNRKKPVFVLKQNNEALYVKLNEEAVKRWLVSIDCEEEVSDLPVGQQYLMNALPMGQFLDSLPSESLQKPSFSLALYTLLHSYSHHLMHDIAEFSGLGIGSLGEYIFPADMAFIVYRRGMTMDLGNLTSMLRNNAPAFLDYLDDRRNLNCGSGSLCYGRGGACPDCILIPEVSCITQNHLLSRTTLIGKDSPRKHGFRNPIRGFLEIAAEG
jgi:hypothetical protein